jgi:hypothetical protein
VRVWLRVVEKCLPRTHYRTHYSRLPGRLPCWVRCAIGLDG